MEKKARKSLKKEGRKEKRGGGKEEEEEGRREGSRGKGGLAWVCRCWRE